MFFFSHVKILTGSTFRHLRVKFIHDLLFQKSTKQWNKSYYNVYRMYRNAYALHLESCPMIYYTPIIFLNFQTGSLPN